MWKPHRKIHTTTVYPVPSSCASPLPACTPGQMEKTASWSATQSVLLTLRLQTPLGQYAPSFRDAASLWCLGQITYCRDLGVRGGSPMKTVNVKESYSFPCTSPHAKCPMACLAGSVHSLVFCRLLCGCLRLSEFPPSSPVHLGLGVTGWSLALCFLSLPVLVPLYSMVPDHGMPLTQPAELESLAE